MDNVTTILFTILNSNEGTYKNTVLMATEMYFTNLTYINYYHSPNVSIRQTA